MTSRIPMTGTLLACIGVTVLTTLGMVGTARLNAQEDSIKNLTNALKVVNTKVVDARVKVMLRNDSSKSVNGIQLSINKSTYQVEFLDADLPSRQVLLPGGTYEEWFSLPSTVDNVEVSVLAVTFDDNTAEGDDRLVREIKDTRIGVKKQLMRFAPFLEEALRSKNANAHAVFERLRVRADSLPDYDGQGSGANRMGQSIAKQRIEFEMDQVEKRGLTNDTGQLRQTLADMFSRQDERIRKLP